MTRADQPAHPVIRRLPIWMTGIGLMVAVLMIIALLTLIISNGLRTLWPARVWEVTAADGTRYLGLAHRTEAIPGAAGARRTLWRIGNRDLYGHDFIWLADSEVRSRALPETAAVIERLEWGPFYGYVHALKTPDGTQDGEAAWRRMQERELPAARQRLNAMRHLERRVIGDINYAMERHRLAMAKAKKLGQPTASHEVALAALEAKYQAVAEELRRLREEDAAFRVVLTDVAGQLKELPISSIVRLHQPNRLGLPGLLAVYASRMGELVFGQPREANSEGGVAPAIFGTVMMTLLMSLAVVPLGVLAALYLHEYAKQGALVSAVRIAVNNLAGVPSIVFGVFGLGFFCYFLGGTIDQLFYPERLPAPTFGGGGILWASLTLALLTVPVVIVSTEEALAAVPGGVREASLACGATKFQTIWQVVLPAAVPGILTGAILAMARGAGEVAPLMITGVVKLAPELPVDHLAPFLHLERKFMHLGFHIYDVGFQSPNIEASKAMVYMTTVLLLGIVLCLNLTAMIFRARLRAATRQSEV